MEPGLVCLTIPKFRLTSPTRHTARGAAVPVGPTCHAIPPRGSSPKFPKTQAASRQLPATSRARLAAVPAAAAPQRLQIPPRLLRSHTGTRATSLLLLPHLSPAAPWELAISRISGRPVLGTMSGGQEDPEGSGDFDWSKLALSFILMRFLEE